MVGVINELNRLDYVATVASCCGHGEKRSIPYLTAIQPRSKIKDVRDLLVARLGWIDIRVFIWREMPPRSEFQLGEFTEGKVYCGYYDTDRKDLRACPDEEEWLIEEEKCYSNG